MNINFILSCFLRYFSNRRQLINCDNSTIRRFFEKDEISNSDLVFSFPKLQKNLLVTYSKESNHSSKFKLFKENIQNNPNFAENSIILEAHLTRKWPIIFHFLLDL